MTSHNILMWVDNELAVNRNDTVHDFLAYLAEQMIAELAKRLKADFGKGFDQSNLWHMRSFYLAFPILNVVRRELTWTHYRLLLRVERQEIRQ